MIGGKRYTATLPTEADARVWEIETRVTAVLRHGAASVTFTGYATGWLAGFIDDAPDRARFEAALEHLLLPVRGSLPLFEVLEADRDELERRVVDAAGDGDEGVARECLQLILEDAAEDLRDSVAADVAGERLGRSPHEVRRLLRAGQVCAHRRAGRWFVPVSEVRRLQRLPQPVGRPFSPGSAWALLAMLSGDDPGGLSAPRRSQLRRHLRDADGHELAARLGRRASRRLVYAHPSMLDALAADPRVVLTGLAAEQAGARLVGADNGEVEGYVAESDIAGLYALHGLVDAEEVANVVLRVVDDAVQVPRRSGMAAAPVVDLDLWESGDARASEAGRRLFAEALETFRER